MRSALFTMITFFAAFAAAHGEDKPGPHGGVIRMPGAYHTELVEMPSNKIKVYLLDIHWKNPTTKNSEVNATFLGKKEAVGTCLVEEMAYVCSFDSSVNLKEKGRLVLKTVREKQKGHPVEYPTPIVVPILPKVDPHHHHH